ncbi:hypothetical protein AWW70_26240 [Bacillus mycoides]|uniref:Uncharacterized protein n=1 Tax=Bacillus mycoides TaxID=1405 RepID=A0A120EBU5_BACMY|nr:hypothetical protein [Bacillus mycoides]KWU54913.1 hypothetical protein AWW70_26240 [Bacillus mycoides]
MTKQLHKGEVAQTLLERINKLAEVCNDAETALVIKDLAEARQIVINKLRAEVATSTLTDSYLSLRM